ncbi:MAG: pilin [bacterium]|nr:pilin [bacterium]
MQVAEQALKKNSFKFLLVACLILICLPLVGIAVDSESPAEQEDPTKGYLQFDPADNTKVKEGGPDVALTTVNRLTFLSGGNDPLSISLNIINVSLTFLGTLSMIMILYGGVVWFTSGDNEEKLGKAKQIIIGAIIGLVLTLGAYSISTLVFDQISTATQRQDDSLSEALND